MDLRRNSYVVPSNAPALPDSCLQDPIIPARVLQERSANRRHSDYLGSNIANHWKHSSSSSPTENLYANNLRAYYAHHGNIASQLGTDKTEDQISYEAAKLCEILKQSEGYRKYREKQDPSDPKQQDHKWPEHMEFAFFKALIRWPPMGRRKHMLDGKLRGRNELVADSIKNDTGVVRSRKQVSSHIQVLKAYFKEYPEILKHMSSQDLAKKQRHTSSTSHLRNHAVNDGTTNGLKYHSYELPSQAASGIWQGCGQLSVPPMLTNPNLASFTTCGSPYTPIRFGMYVRVDEPVSKTKREIHTFTELSTISKLEDIHVTDIRQWRKQFPELSSINVEDWQNRDVIVCDASIQLMVENLPSGAELSVSFEMMSKRDFGISDYLECRTCFYDEGQLVPQEGNDVRPKRLDHDPRQRGPFNIPFGSSFWVRRMSYLAKHLRDARTLNKQAQKIKSSQVRRNLQFLIAVQELYAVRTDTNESKCILTILWRFNQAKSNEEGGKTNWRNVTFSSLIQPLQWHKADEEDPLKDFNIIPRTQTTNYDHLPLQFSTQPFADHHPPFDLDHISTIGLDSNKDFSHPNSASTLSHSQDTSITQSHDMGEANNVDFTGGHINICLEPAISLGAYENFNNTHSNPLNSLDGISDLTHVHDNNSTFGDMGLGVSVGNYTTRPWPYHDMLDRLEGLEAGIAQSGELGNHMQGHDIGGHETSHDPQVETGLWKLQSPFAEDTAVGAQTGVRIKDFTREQDHSALLALAGVDHREKAGRYLGF